MTSTFEPFEVFPGIANGAIERLYLHQTNVPHTLPAAEGFDRGLRRMHRLYGHRYLVLFIGQLSRVGAPDEEVRNRLVKTLRDQTILPTSAALAILSPGLIGATGRSVVTGILMAARLPFVVRVFGTVPEAFQFLQREAQREGIALPNLTTVEAALATLRHTADLALKSGPAKEGAS